MKSFKFLLPILAWLLCSGSALSSSTNRMHAIFISDKLGLAAISSVALTPKATDFAQVMGLSYGTSVLVHDWNNQQALEIESLIAGNRII
ncbi:putative exported protein [Chlamydia ibidis]|uniref:Exported protein n=2 Tax=Chlamydia ibidis TaxID=1405396 RepID=A0ABP2XDM8_9CHLA|nr:hypothetical protein [Chlamydia ibidis]EPP34835.1 putative exported protein [Chlamydia ibidis]EQM62335.1 putative exported protein [Chlamydia ibidis 10-1398/6]